MDEGKILWTDGPLWGKKRIVSEEERALEPELFDRVEWLLNEGNVQVTLYWAVDTRDFWYE